MKYDQDLCLNLRYKLNPRVRCAFGNVIVINDHPSLVEDTYLILYKWQFFPGGKVLIKNTVQGGNNWKITAESIIILETLGDQSIRNISILNFTDMYICWR